MSEQGVIHHRSEQGIVAQFITAAAALEYLWSLFGDLSLTPYQRTVVGRMLCRLISEADHEQRDPTYRSNRMFSEGGWS